MSDTPALPIPYGTPWSLGVRCDGQDCDTSFEGDFLVAENSTRDERLGVVLGYVERRGWRVIWRRPTGESLSYCPPCSATSPPTGTAPAENHSAPDGAVQEDERP